MPSAIGVDVGATKVAIALVDPSSGDVQDLQRFPTAIEGGSRAVLKACVAACERLAGERPVDRIGVGVCEVVDGDGALRSACAIDWRGVDVARAFSHIAPTRVESDVRAAAIAEARFGAGRDLGSFLYVNAGSGTSSCFVSGGVPIIGARGAAILIGAGPLDAERVAGGLGIARAYGVAAAEDVVRAADAGDEQAMSVLAEGGAALGSAVGFAVNLLDPEAVIVGGGVGLNAPMYRAALERSMRESIWLEEGPPVPLLCAALGVAAGVVGAAVAVLDRTLVGAA